MVKKKKKLAKDLFIIVLNLFHKGTSSGKFFGNNGDIIPGHKNTGFRRGFITL